MMTKIVTQAQRMKVQRGARGTYNSKNDHSALSPFLFLENRKKEEMKMGSGKEGGKRKENSDCHMHEDSTEY